VDGDLDAQERRAVRLGVAGAVLAFLALATVQAVAIRPYLPPDELYHVGYAATVLDGRLPTLTTPLPADRVPLAPDDGRARRVYVANHPPLFYAVTAAPLGLGEWLGMPRAGFLAARLLSIALAAGGLIAVAWLALLLAPGRPRVAVGAAWLAALLPSLPHVAAFVYNDGLVFLAAGTTLAAAVAVVRRGPTLPRLAGLTVAAAVAALTKAPGLVLVALAGVAAVAGVLLHGRQALVRRALVAAGTGTVVGVIAGGAAAGYYLRNRSLYGSLTGAAYNQELFRFKPQDHTLDLLVSPPYALRLYDGLWVWTRFNLPRVPVPALAVAVPRVVGVLALAGLAVAAAGHLRRRRPADAAAVAAWALALAWLAAVYAMVAAYDGNGGHLHPRYLFPGLPVLAVVAAVGLDRLAGGRHGLWVPGVALAQLVLTGMAWAGFVTALDGRRPGGPDGLLGEVADLLGTAGLAWPWPALAVAGALLAGAFGLLGLALARLRPPGEPEPRPTAPRALESTHAA
jgi:hypothetical protein